MTEENLTLYMPYIKEAYRSFETPDFSFAKKTLSARPYDRLIKVLRNYAAIEEHTQGEEDVCFSYFLKGRAALWKLDLSIVGPFAMFVRLSNSINRQDFLHHRSGDLIDFERKIIDTIRAGGIKFMTCDELETKVPVTLVNTPKEEVSLYQTLFTDRPVPWS